MKRQECIEFQNNDRMSRWVYLDEAGKSYTTLHTRTCFANLQPCHGAAYICAKFVDEFSIYFKTREYTKEYLTDLLEMGFLSGLVYQDVETLIKKLVARKLGVTITFRADTTTYYEFLLVSSLIRLVSEYPHYLYVYLCLKGLFPHKPKLLLLFLSHGVWCEEFSFYYGQGHCLFSKGVPSMPLRSVEDVMKEVRNGQPIRDTGRTATDLNSLWPYTYTRSMPKLWSKELTEFVEKL